MFGWLIFALVLFVVFVFFYHVWCVYRQYFRLSDKLSQAREKTTDDPDVPIESTEEETKLDEQEDLGYVSE